MQHELFIDSLSEALDHAVSQLGGPKKVGSVLWPEKSMEEARKALLNSLHPEHAQKLSLEQIDLLFSMASSAGIHAPLKYLGDRYGYEIKPVTSEQRKADAAERVEKAVAAMNQALKDYERAG